MGLYTIDVLNSKIAFNVRFLEFSKVSGHFTSFSGTIKAFNDNDLLNHNIEVEIDVASINTNESSRDKHLISADFFHADLYPKIHFKKTGVEKVDASHFKLLGELQIKDITKEIIFDVEVKYPRDHEKSLLEATYNCTTKINRFDFGLVYGSVLENTPFFIAKDIYVEASFQLQPE